jgi:hypothetical protein
MLQPLLKLRVALSARPRDRAVTAQQFANWQWLQQQCQQQTQQTLLALLQCLLGPGQSAVHTLWPQQQQQQQAAAFRSSSSSKQQQQLQ